MDELNGSQNTMRKTVYSYSGSCISLKVLASPAALCVYDDKDYAQDENSTDGNVMLSLMSGYPHG